MNIILDPVRLQRDIMLAFSLSSKSTTTKIINCLYLKAIIEDNQGYLIIRATNYDMSCETKIVAEVKEEGALCLSSIFFSKLIKEYVKPIYLRKDNNWVYIISNKSETRLPCFDADEFPETTFNLPEKHLKLSAKQLNTAFNKTLFCVSEDTSKRRLMGINLRIDDNKLSFIATDSYRASWYMIFDLPTTVDFTINIIIPKNSVSEIQKLIHLGDDSVLLYFNERELILQYKNNIFRSVLIEDSFPNMKSMFTKNRKNILEINKEKFSSALRILNMFNFEKKTSMKLICKNNTIFIEIEKNNFGESKNEIECTYEGEDITIGFDIHYFLECLKTFEDSEKDNIVIKFDGNKESCTIKIDDIPEYTYLGMPTALRW